MAEASLWQEPQTCQGYCGSPQGHSVFQFNTNEG